MTKVVSGDNCTVKHKTEDGSIEEFVVTVKFYEDGRVIQQYGDGEDWLQICDPDQFTPLVGICIDCQKQIYKADEWFESTDGRLQHALDTDCDSTESTLKMKIKKSECHGKCGRCGRTIMPKQEFLFDDQLEKIVHDNAKDCGE